MRTFTLRDVVFIAIIIGMACLLVGFLFGVGQTVTYLSKVAVRLIELKKINVDIDEQMLQDAYFQYKERVGGCLFLEGNGTNIL